MSLFFVFVFIRKETFSLNITKFVFFFKKNKLFKAKL